MAESHLNPSACVVRVRARVAGLEKDFDYLFDSQRLGSDAQVGDIVRIELRGRRVDGWIVGLDPPLETRQASDLSSVLAVFSGTNSEVLSLCEWTAQRYFGPLHTLLTLASPARRVAKQPKRSLTAPKSQADASGAGRVRLHALSAGASPKHLIASLVTEKRRTVLVVVSRSHQVKRLCSQLRALELNAVALPGEFAKVITAIGGAGHDIDVVVGSRAAVFAPVPNCHLGAIVVVGEHDDALTETRSPTFSAVEVAAERARRAQVELVLTSTFMSVRARRIAQRSGSSTHLEGSPRWPRFAALDQRSHDPARGMYSEELVQLLRADGQVLVVLDRLGGFRVVFCKACDEPVRCEVCGSGMETLSKPQTTHDPATKVFRCRNCLSETPQFCRSCGGLRFARRSPGVTQVATDLADILREPVESFVAGQAQAVSSRVVVGTSGVLEGAGRVDRVLYIDPDATLLSGRVHAAEILLRSVSLAARLLAPRGSGRAGTVVFNTRLPQHPLLMALVSNQPEQIEAFMADEALLRQSLELPPFVASAFVSGPNIEQVLEQLEVLPTPIRYAPQHGGCVVMAESSELLNGALREAGLPARGMKVETDPSWL